MNYYKLDERYIKRVGEWGQLLSILRIPENKKDLIPRAWRKAFIMIKPKRGRK